MFELVYLRYFHLKIEIIQKNKSLLTNAKHMHTTC
jgi:hypothetical protein